MDRYQGLIRRMARLPISVEELNLDAELFVLRDSIERGKPDEPGIPWAREWMTS